MDARKLVWRKYYIPVGSGKSCGLRVAHVNVYLSSLVPMNHSLCRVLAIVQENYKIQGPCIPKGDPQISTQSTSRLEKKKGNESSRSQSSITLRTFLRTPTLSYDDKRVFNVVGCRVSSTYISRSS